MQPVGLGEVAADEAAGLGEVAAGRRRRHAPWNMLLEMPRSRTNSLLYESLSLRFDHIYGIARVDSGKVRAAAAFGVSQLWLSRITLGCRCAAPACGLLVRGSRHALQRLWNLPVCLLGVSPPMQARRMDVIICSHDEWPFALVRQLCTALAVPTGGVLLPAQQRCPWQCMRVHAWHHASAHWQHIELSAVLAPPPAPARCAGGLDRLPHLFAPHAPACQGLRHVPEQPQASVVVGRHCPVSGAACGGLHMAGRPSPSVPPGMPGTGQRVLLLPNLPLTTPPTPQAAAQGGRPLAHCSRRGSANRSLGPRALAGWMGTRAARGDAARRVCAAGAAIPGAFRAGCLIVCFTAGRKMH